MESLAISVIWTFLALFFSFVVYVLLNKVFRPFLRKMSRDKAPLLVDVIDDLMKVLAPLISIFIFLLCASYALSWVSLDQLLLGSIISIIPRIFVVLLLLIITFFLIQVIKSIFRRSRHEYMQILSAFIQAMIGFASILTILDNVGIRAAPFLEIFKVILYTICLTIALALGISIALAIQGQVKQFIFNADKQVKVSPRNRRR